MLKEIVSSRINPKNLKQMREEGKVKYKVVGYVESGKRKGQPTKFEYLTSDVLMIWDKGSIEKGFEKGGNTMDSNWRQSNKAGQSYLRLVKGAQIRERTREDGVSKSYDLIYRNNGDRIPKVMKGITDRDSAKIEAYRMLAEIEDRKNNVVVPINENVKEKSVLKIKEIVPKFLREKAKENIDTFRSLELIFKNRLIPFFGHLRMDELTLRHQKDYRDKRREEDIADITIGKEIMPISSLFIFAKDEGFYDGANPVNIKKLKLLIVERDRHMSSDEQELIWAELKKYPLLNDLALFAYGTTMRPTNIVNDCTWDRVHWDEKEKWIFIPKNVHKNRKKDGNYLLTKRVMTMLKRRREESKDFEDFSHIFWRMENGKPVKISEAWIQRAWNEVLRNIGIREKEEAEGQARLRFYDLKHTRLSRLACETGGNLFILKRISNHSDTKSLERYVKGIALNGHAMEALERDDEENEKA